MKFNGKKKERFGWFSVLAALIFLYFIILRWGQFVQMIGQMFHILQPIIFGLLFAYLLRSPVNFLEQKILDHRKSQTLRLLNSVLIVYSIVVICIFFVGKLVWPELQKNVVNMLTALPDQIAYISDQLAGLMENEEQMDGFMATALEHLYQKIQLWMQYDLWNYVEVVLSAVTTGVIDVMAVLFNVIVGAIVSVYVLLERKHFSFQSRKLIYAFLKPEKAKLVLETIEEADRIFSGFITGKIIDSVIIGLLCFISLTFLKMPYTVLVSVIVGVTNVIPFFGPYLGAIPSAILIFLVDWQQGLLFILFIILLQQLDGNVIGPKILGESTGLASFWVVFAILVAGGLFGVPGMVVGVPAFATFYYIVKMFVNDRLNKNGSLKYVIDQDGQKPEDQEEERNDE